MLSAGGRPTIGIAYSLPLDARRNSHSSATWRQGRLDAHTSVTQARANAALADAQARAERVAALAVVIAAKAGDEGKLFGSVGTRDIAEAITKLGEAVQAEFIAINDIT